MEECEDENIREGSSDRHFRELARPQMISVRQKILERGFFHPHLTFVQPQLHELRRQWHPTPVLLPGKSHGWRSLVGCSPWGLEESDTTERLHFYFSLSCIGEGNGNPLQCSCLENPGDGGAWWAAVCGVAQSRTRLKRLSSRSSSFMRQCGFTVHHMGVKMPSAPPPNSCLLLHPTHVSLPPNHWYPCPLPVRVRTPIPISQYSPWNFFGQLHR